MPNIVTVNNLNVDVKHFPVCISYLHSCILDMSMKSNKIKAIKKSTAEADLSTIGPVL